MADKLLLEDVRFYGQHGLTKAEQTVGAWFSVDAELALDLGPAAGPRRRVAPARRAPGRRRRGRGGAAGRVVRAGRAPRGGRPGGRRRARRGGGAGRPGRVAAGWVGGPPQEGEAGAAPVGGG